MEYYLIYDIATGAIEFRGSGPPGFAANHAATLPAGKAIILVPLEAVTGNTVDLDLLKVRAAEGVDASAETVRLRFITPGAGQAMTYQYKAAEAVAWGANHAASTPFLSAEAGARGTTVGVLAGEILMQVAAWTVVGSRIEAARIGAKLAIVAAANIPAIVAAAVVDWSAVTAA